MLTGGIIAAGVIAVAIIFFTTSPVSGNADLDVEGIRLTAFHDGAGIDIVDAEILLTVSRHVKVLLEGDVKTKTLFGGALYTAGVERSGDGLIIHYKGLLELTETKSVGDEVEILIRHGAGETRIITEIGRG